MFCTTHACTAYTVLSQKPSDQVILKSFSVKDQLWRFSYRMVISIIITDICHSPTILCPVKKDLGTRMCSL